ncbi:hypothetical protein EJ05DRAFT_500677 [Pseudovirgaria hyperparasitica]|uniref:WSC domain-containing protein n=1 Tax=Pseudovirgaria hyperparasitica TaxID=470096 RepID=A0A6A6W878_9PEZI|nr:uncharacterized protein EJ05DRAFT_500677 [Pseudovirgaria hyperparasitica]KAF2758160.1 hypothetical protein EJ05DRAFT_500677 [Pseudovirgaria hyperparasitica]
MVSFILKTAFLAASLIQQAVSQSTAPTPIATPTSHPQLIAPKYRGCFDNPGPLVDYGPAIYQSTGNCAPICAGLKKPIMALVDGSNCWCGDFLPPKSSQTSDDECRTPCQGYDVETCGGNAHWAVFQDGLNGNTIDYYEPSTSSSAPPTGATGGTTVVQTVPGSVQTETSAPTKSPENGSNTAAIAAGVVVAVLAVAAIIGGVFFFLRRRRSQHEAEAYRRHQSMQSFTQKPPQTASSDTRLDPEIMMRRQSDGSIADNQDYSRRILQVRNF